MGIEQIIQAVIGANGENAANEANIRRQQAASTQSDSDLVLQTMGAIVGAKQQELQGKLDAQEAGIAVRNQLENNPSDPNSFIASMTQQFVSAGKKAQAQQAEIAQKEQVGIFDNPLEWMVNYITLPDARNALAATQSQQTQAAKTIAEMQQLTTASAQAQRETARTLTDASIAQQLQITAAESALKANALHRESLGYDLGAIEILTKASNDLASHMLAINSEARAAEHLQLAREAASRESEKFEFWKNEVKQEKEAEAKMANTMSIGATALGFKGMSAKDILFMKKTDPERYKQVAGEWYAQGRYIESTGDNTLGKNAGDSAVKVTLTQGLNSPAQTNVRQLLTSVTKQAWDELKLDPKYANAKSPNDPIIRGALAQQVQDILYGKQDPKRTPEENAKKGLLWKLNNNVEHTDGLLSAPDLKVLAAMDSVKSLPGYAEVIAPAAALNVSSKAASMVAQFEAAIEAGKITPKEAAYAHAQLYKAATNVNNVNNDVARLRLPLQQQYIAEVPAANALLPGATDRFDQTNEGSMYQYFTMRQRIRAYQSSTLQQSPTMFNKRDLINPDTLFGVGNDALKPVIGRQ